MNASETTEATVIIVEDEDSVRESLEVLIRAADYRCVSFASGEAFLAAALPHVPCCLLLDIQLGGQSGLDVQSELNARNATLPIVFVSGDDNTSRAVGAMKSGAMDYLPKPFDPDQLLERVASALQVSVDAKDHRESADQDAALLGALTQREIEILALLAGGKFNKEIAQSLSISTRTVESHRMHIMQKLQAHTVADLTRLWMRSADAGYQGLTHAPDRRR